MKGNTQRDSRATARSSSSRHCNTKYCNLFHLHDAAYSLSSIQHPSVAKATGTVLHALSNTNDPSRRMVISSIFLLSSITAARPAFSSVLDEDVSQSVYDVSKTSAVAVSASAGSTIEGLGSGVLWDAYGHVLTNYHCISKAVKTDKLSIQVTLTNSDGKPRVYDARITGYDTQNDLAILKFSPLEDDHLIPAKIGSSKDMKVGQFVFSLGGVPNQAPSLSSGVVSGLNRVMLSPAATRIYGVIQTDSQVNAGNSGGPLVDSSGVMVGLATQPAFRTAGTTKSNGVNFAIPTDLLLTLVPNLIVYGNSYGKGL